MFLQNNYSCTKISNYYIVLYQLFILLIILLYKVTRYIQVFLSRSSYYIKVSVDLDYAHAMLAIHKQTNSQETILGWFVLHNDVHFIFTCIT